MNESTPITAVSTANAPAAIGPYSQGIVAGGFLFISGQLPMDPATGELIEADMAAKTRRILDNIGAIAAAAGAGLEQVVKTTIFLTDMADFATVNGVYGQYFGDAPPARSTVQVAGLPKGASIEMEAVVSLG